ncbi:universal stress protein [Streptomyces nigra]|uniref:universal stress protein n=1 Tax=Streptomyces nigra TaxID=1827580 RepID=UPI0036B53A6F
MLTSCGRSVPDANVPPCPAARHGPPGLRSGPFGPVHTGPGRGDAGRGRTTVHRGVRRHVMGREIITGVDRSARSRAAADWAAREALSRGLPLRVIHVSPSDPPKPAERRSYRPESVADQVVAEHTGRHPSLRARGPHLTGAPVAELRTTAEDAELLVLGLLARAGPRNRVGRRPTLSSGRASGLWCWSPVPWRAKDRPAASTA